MLPPVHPAFSLQQAPLLYSLVRWDSTVCLLFASSKCYSSRLAAWTCVSWKTDVFRRHLPKTRGAGGSYLIDPPPLLWAAACHRALLAANKLSDAASSGSALPVHETHNFENRQHCRMSLASLLFTLCHRLEGERSKLSPSASSTRSLFPWSARSYLLWDNRVTPYFSRSHTPISCVVCQLMPHTNELDFCRPRRNVTFTAEKSFVL